MFTIPYDGFQRTLSQILWTRCSNYGLTISSNAAASTDHIGVLDRCVVRSLDRLSFVRVIFHLWLACLLHVSSVHCSSHRRFALSFAFDQSNPWIHTCGSCSGGDNLNLVFACNANAKLAVALRVEQYNVTANQSHVSSRANYKSTQKFDANGKRTAITCAGCTKPIKEGTTKHVLACCTSGCFEMSHVRCSRWAKVDAALIPQNQFFCDGCLPTMPLQYLDFVAAEAAQSSVLTKLDFEILNVQRPTNDDTAMCMLSAPSHAIVGIGTWKYTCTAAKERTAIVQLDYFLRHASSMCYTTATPSNNADKKPAVPFAFPFLKSTVVPSTLDLHALALWPLSHVTPVAETLYLAKSVAQLDQAFLYEFDGKDERYAVGSGDGAEVWCGLQTSRAKCMKLLTEASSRQSTKTPTKEAKAKKREAKKPHVERTLEKK
ncbi:Aste57867_11574 [Aphanomyces stellatus]|uniref:Aste57867_11574 protein n=1 Tax=Aphanomyces stellatus TaxID=120398 RepID=A0A485KUI2_9STRA|nr:hypothetical protein As57867_011531 [Aphanomyces stellatus]VFT88433.1 Aste57867_11574 [Aphanomyces stellatus]